MKKVWGLLSLIGGLGLAIFTGISTIADYNKDKADDDKDDGNVHYIQPEGDSYEENNEDETENN